MCNVQFNRALQKTQCEVISSCVIKWLSDNDYLQDDGENEEQQNIIFKDL